MELNASLALYIILVLLTPDPVATIGALATTVMNSFSEAAIMIATSFYGAVTFIFQALVAIMKASVQAVICVLVLAVLQKCLSILQVKLPLLFP